MSDMNDNYMTSDNIETLRKQLEQGKPQVPAIHQRQYFHSADFTLLNALVKEINESIRQINVLLPVEDSKELDGMDPDDLRMFAYEELKKQVNEFLNEWAMQTNGFTGGSKLSPKGLITDEKNDPVFHASRRCVDHIRRAISYRDRPNKLELLMIMRMLKHSFSWTTLEAVHYTVGITSQRVQPLTFHLEKDQIRSPGVASAVSADSRKRKFKVPWKKTRIPDELRSASDDLTHLDNEPGGT